MDKINLTIIIDKPYNNKSLKRTIDSILLYQSIDIEIIINCCNDNKIKYIIEEYRRRFPNIFILLHSGIDNFKNKSIKIASGDYLLFAKCGEVFSHNIFKSIKDIDKESEYDIIIFEKLIISNDKNKLYKTTTLSKDNFTALELYISGNIPIDNFIKILNRSTIYNNHISFKEIGSFSDIAFNIDFFTITKKYLILNKIGAYENEYYSRIDIHKTLNNEISNLSKWIDYLDTLPTKTLNINDQELLSKFIYKIYNLKCGIVFDIIQSANRKGNLYVCLKDINFSKLAKNYLFNKYLIKNYAILNAALNKTSQSNIESNTYWKSFIPNKPMINSPVAYIYSSTLKQKNPILSIIMPNYNKAFFIKKCLKSILSQSMRDFEILIVDDCSTDDSWEILCHYADLFPEIRLWRMKNNVRQGACRNFAINKARGKYIIFIDSDDFVEPLFFDKALYKITQNQADMVIFGFQCRDKHNVITYIKQYDERTITGAEAEELYLKDELIGACWSTIYNIEFIRNSGCLFAENIYHQDHFFTGNILKKASSILLSDFIAYNLVLSENSSTRPLARNYLHIYSGIQLFAHMASLTGHNLQKQLYASRHLIWNLQTMLLHSWYAFINTYDEIALKDSDFEILSKNSLFILSMLKGYASLLERATLISWEKYEKNIIINFQESIIDPILTVIIPIYNQEKLLTRCITSVINQSLREIEIILIDDASTDNSLSVCEQWKKKDRRIRLLKNAINKGQGYSRNRGLAEAKGKFITFIDSDDYILPDFFLRGVSLLNSFPDIDFVHFLKTSEYQNVKLHIPTIMSGKSLLIEYCKGEISFNEVWGNIYRKNLIDENNILFPEHLYEDSPFLLNIFHNAKKILTEPQIAYAYGTDINKTSAMRSLKFLPRHYHSNIALAASISTFFNNHPEIPNGSELAYYRLKKRYHNFIKGKFLYYIVELLTFNIQPIASEDMNNIERSPEFLRILLEDYALLYINKYNLKNTNTFLYTDPLASCSYIDINHVSDIMIELDKTINKYNSLGYYKFELLSNYFHNNPLSLQQLLFPFYTDINLGTPSLCTKRLAIYISKIEILINVLISDYAKLWKDLNIEASS